MNRQLNRLRIAKQALRFSVIAALFTHSGESTARAATVANYTFTGNSLSSNDADASSTAGDVVIAAGLSGHTTFFTPSFSGVALGVTSDFTPATEAAAISGNDYIGFTMTPANGVSLAYNALSFNPQGTNFSNTITENISVRWSVDNFATTVGSGTLTLNPGQGGTGGGSATLTGSPAQSGAVEFRFYFYDDQNSNVSTVGIDNIALTASVVPEPSSALLLLAGSLALAMRRR